MKITGKMLPLVANLPQVTTTPTENLRISLRIFEKNGNQPNVVIRGWGKTILEKKHAAKNLVTLSL
jgi:hypothetical protein